MKLSVDTSFFLAVTNAELKHTEVVEATLRLMRGDTDDEFYLSVFAYEELCRLRTELLPDLESVTARRAAEATLLRESATVTMVDRGAARALGGFWTMARTKGKFSETVDTLIARDAARTGCTLVTCDEAQAKYTQTVFGDSAVYLVTR